MRDRGVGCWGDGGWRKGGDGYVLPRYCDEWGQ